MISTYYKHQLNATERSTFQKHIGYASLDGFVRGALILNEFIFIKQLGGGNVQLAFLFQFSMVIYLFSMVANEIMRRYPNRKILLRWVSIITRMPLILFAFFPAVHGQGLPPQYHTLFLGVFLLFYTSRIAVIPSINQYLKGNYRSENFGRLFGYATTINKVMTMITTFAVGVLLDWDPNSYRWFYPAVGVLGTISVFQLTMIPFHHKPDLVVKPMSQALGDSFKRIWKILCGNVPFRHLEVGFMLYGFAWMSTHAVITIFYKEALHLNYSGVSFYNNAYTLMAILVLPIFSKMIGKMDPRRFGLITFGSLLLFILFTSLTQTFDSYYIIAGVKIYPCLMIAVLFNGTFMGSMPLLWGIGSSYFCSSNEAADYQSVHLFLTGVRAVFAPLLGISLYEMLGFSMTYGASIIILIPAILLMIFSANRHPVIHQETTI